MSGPDRVVLTVYTLIHGQCEIFLDEIQQKLLEDFALGVSWSGIWRSFQHSGYSMKKVNIVRFSNEGVATIFCKVMRPAIERNVVKRRRYLQRINGFTPEQLVFSDKTSCDCCTTNRG